MKKIPTLFLRDPNTPRRVTGDVTPGCEWVLDGLGRPTRKRDGTCVRIGDNGERYVRREVKPGKPWPEGFEAVEHDPRTEKTVGWVPAAGSPFERYLNEALEAVSPLPGTYELCGPRINGNPEGFDHHVLLEHGTEEEFGPFGLGLAVPTGINLLEEARAFLECIRAEGVVWWGPDGRRAKLKRRDLGLPWPASKTELEKQQ